jgi:hypothetical protein
VCPGAKQEGGPGSAMKMALLCPGSAFCFFVTAPKPLVTPAASSAVRPAFEPRSDSAPPGNRDPCSAVLTWKGEQGGSAQLLALRATNRRPQGRVSGREHGPGKTWQDHAPAELR